MRYCPSLIGTLNHVTFPHSFASDHIIPCGFKWSPTVSNSFPALVIAIVFLLCKNNCVVMSWKRFVLFLCEAVLITMCETVKLNLCVYIENTNASLWQTAVFLLWEVCSVVFQVHPCLWLVLWQLNINLSMWLRWRISELASDE